MVLDEPTNDLDMDTLDLLEDVLADYEGTLLLVSHDRDFIDRLATSTIALNGRGGVVETPGGWTDLLSQNPGFFGAGEAPARSRGRDTTPAPAPASSGSTRKLSFKDTHRLKELEGRLAALPAEIATLEARLADPALYARSPAEFAKVSANLDRKRAEAAAAEDEWLSLEEKREALAS
jgi:ATP-binding cassette subfamily F protein uup